MSEPIEACKLLPGMLLARKYRLTCRIGQGAMGVVWAARNEATGREVALKLIARPDPALRKRLLREAQSCGALQHPNLVDVIDVARTEGGEPCLIMELLVGDSVAALLEARRRLDAPLSVRIARDVASALAAAHAVGIVHRDLKPANVFLHRPPEASDFVVKVLDFGVAKNLAAAGGVTSTLHAVVGSPFYMSPEQLRAEASLDARSDLWSLGVMLFEMLTGVRPFQGEGTQLLSQILAGEIPKVSRYLRHVDERLVRIVDRCLRRAPEERFRSAEEVARELEGLVRGRASEPRGEGELRIPGARAALPSGVTAEQEAAVAPFRGRGSGVSAEELATTAPLGPRDTPGRQNGGEDAAAWQGARAVRRSGALRSSSRERRCARRRCPYRRRRWQRRREDGRRPRRGALPLERSRQWRNRCTRSSHDLRRRWSAAHRRPTGSLRRRRSGRRRLGRSENAVPSSWRSRAGRYGAPPLDWSLAATARLDASVAAGHSVAESAISTLETADSATQRTGSTLEMCFWAGEWAISNVEIADWPAEWAISSVEAGDGAPERATSGDRSRAGVALGWSYGNWSVSCANPAAPSPLSTALLPVPPAPAVPTSMVTVSREGDMPVVSR
ncbi:serine/threonine-protein kinase [Sorangium sp. So ce1036]|uniref:serine/threonine-protein kinase n=1 Tax=Sorangium sp. So ce1036 TaxID=3133328 RepID=UPI003F06F53A